jgi:hypothetical protein
MPPGASPDAQTAKSSQLLAAICNAALQREVCQVAGWDLHADALTSPGVDWPAVLIFARSVEILSAPTIEELHGRD